MSGLTLVTLPIGNTGDITLRALEALKNGTHFYAEDTRVFKDLLKAYGIDYSNKMIDSYHDQSVGKIDLIIEKIKEGSEIFLVSDAGSPVVSDPAFPLVKRVLEEGLKLNTFSGITAVISALELSGLPPHPFHFWGFAPRGKGERIESFKKLKYVSGTHLFYESPHRIFETIESFFAVNPDLALVVARELTKTFQTVVHLDRHNLNEVKSLVVDKGEFVILFHQNEVSHPQVSEELLEMCTDYLSDGGGTKKLAKIFSKINGEDVKTIYDKLSRSK